MTAGHARLQLGVGVALALSALSIVMLLVSVVRAKRRARSLPTQGRLRRSRVSLGRLAVMQAVFVAVVATLYALGAWKPRSIGVSHMPPYAAFLAGALEYGIFAKALPTLRQLLGVQQKYAAAALRVHRYFLLPTRRQRLALLLLMCVNPFTEELIFRGLLVHQFARVGAPLWLAVLVGALVNVANHWYQGRALVRSHLAFYAWSVVLLYSPVGMLGAMGFHFLADIWPSLYQRQMLEEYRAQRRARLASANKPAKPAA